MKELKHGTIFRGNTLKDGCIYEVLCPKTMDGFVHISNNTYDEWFYEKLESVQKKFESGEYVIKESQE